MFVRKLVCVQSILLNLNMQLIISYQINIPNGLRSTGKLPEMKIETNLAIN